MVLSNIKYRSGPIVFISDGPFKHCTRTSKSGILVISRNGDDSLGHRFSFKIEI